MKYVYMKSYCKIGKTGVHIKSFRLFKSLKMAKNDDTTLKFIKSPLSRAFKFKDGKVKEIKNYKGNLHWYIKDYSIQINRIGVV